MEKYLQQLLSDIAHAAANVDWPYSDTSLEQDGWMINEEEEKTAPRRPLEEWTGIQKSQLPPDELLTDEQLDRLFEALQNMLEEYNWMFVTIGEVPVRIQYRTLRDNFDQTAIIKRWHMGFFAMCKPGTAHNACVMGEYCHCRFFEEMYAQMADENLSPEEERRQQLDCEVAHIKRKYGDDWMKYYPYHLDPEYDDENGNPYDYGLGSLEEDEDEEEDDWWQQ